MRTLQRRAAAFATSVMCLLSLGAAYGATNLRVSANGHYIETADGAPFLYLNDTEWILNKHPDDKILRLLDDRQKKGFTVIKISTCGLNYHYGVDSEDHTVWSPERHSTMSKVTNLTVILKWRISDEIFRRYDLDENRIAQKKTGCCDTVDTHIYHPAALV